MRRFPGVLAWALLGAALCLRPALARADTSVIVLGIQSVEGDDDFARDLTGALRHAASQMRGWAVSDRDVSLAQMVNVQGCTEPDAACMAEMARALVIQRIVYGVVRRTSTSQNFRFAVTLSTFNADTGAIENTVTDSIPRAEAEIDFLRQRVQRYVTQLAGRPQVGSIAVRANVEQGTVSIDGTPAGNLTGGAFTATDVEAGPHLVEVAAEGYTTHTSRVNVEVGQQAEVSAELVATQEGGGGGGGGVPIRPILGWTAIGASVVFAALTVYSMISIDAFNDEGSSDPDTITWFAFRDTVPVGQDSCDAADQRAFGTEGVRERQWDAAQRVCDKASTLTILQYVFGGLSIAAAAGGIALLAAGGGDDDTEARPEARRRRAPRLVLSPTIHTQGGSLAATLRF